MKINLNPGLVNAQKNISPSWVYSYLEHKNLEWYMPLITACRKKYWEFESSLINIARLCLRIIMFSDSVAWVKSKHSSEFMKTIPDTKCMLSTHILWYRYKLLSSLQCSSDQCNLCMWDSIPHGNSSCYLNAFPWQWSTTQRYFPCLNVPWLCMIVFMIELANRHDRGILN